MAVLPSYHRPDLINYSIKRESITAWSNSNAGLLRPQICLRPNPIDHPNFSGSNPALGGLANFTQNIIWQADERECYAAVGCR